jgi:hypothetical protein
MSRHHKVQGKCPACQRDALFLGAGGYVTCGNLDCPQPDLASDMLLIAPNLIGALVGLSNE